MSRNYPPSSSSLHKQKLPQFPAAESTETEVVKLQALVRKLERQNESLRKSHNPYDSDQSLDSSVSGVSSQRALLISESDDPNSPGIFKFPTSTTTAATHNKSGNGGETRSARRPIDMEDLLPQPRRSTVESIGESPSADHLNNNNNQFKERIPSDTSDCGNVLRSVPPDNRITPRTTPSILPEKSPIISGEPSELVMFCVSEPADTHRHHKRDSGIKDKHDKDNKSKPALSNSINGIKTVPNVKDNRDATPSKNKDKKEANSTSSKQATVGKTTYEDDSWLVRLPKTSDLNEKSDFDVMSPIQWMRSVFDNPTGDIIKAKMALRLRLEEIERFGRLRSVSMSHPAISTVGMSMAFPAAFYASNSQLGNSIPGDAGDSLAKSRQFTSTGSQTNLLSTAECQPPTALDDIWKKENGGAEVNSLVSKVEQSLQMRDFRSLGNFQSLTNSDPHLSGSVDMNDVRQIARRQEEELKAQVNNALRSRRDSCSASTDRLHQLSTSGSRSDLRHQLSRESSGSDVDIRLQHISSNNNASPLKPSSSTLVRQSHVSAQRSRSTVDQPSLNPPSSSPAHTATSLRQQRIASQSPHKGPPQRQGHVTTTPNQLSRSQSNHNISLHSSYDQSKVPSKDANVSRARSFTPSTGRSNLPTPSSTLSRSNSGEDLNRYRRQPSPSSSASTQRRASVQVHHIADAAKPQAPPRSRRPPTDPARSSALNGKSVPPTSSSSNRHSLDLKASRGAPLGASSLHKSGSNPQVSHQVTAPSRRHSTVPSTQNSREQSARQSNSTTRPNAQQLKQPVDNGVAESPSDTDYALTRGYKSIHYYEEDF